MAASSPVRVKCDMKYWELICAYVRIIHDVVIQPLKSGYRWTAVTYAAATRLITRTTAKNGATVFAV